MVLDIYYLFITTAAWMVGFYGIYPTPKQLIPSFLQFRCFHCVFGGGWGENSVLSSRGVPLVSIHPTTLPRLFSPSSWSFLTTASCSQPLNKYMKMSCRSIVSVLLLNWVLVTHTSKLCTTICCCVCRWAWGLWMDGQRIWEPIRKWWQCRKRFFKFSVMASGFVFGEAW